MVRSAHRPARWPLLAVALGLCAVLGAWPGAARGQAKCDRDSFREAFSGAHLVPDVRGCPAEPARQALWSLDHPASIQVGPGPPPAGLVIDQTPSPGSPVTYPLQIVLVASDGSEASANQAVPNGGDGKKAPPQALSADLLVRVLGAPAASVAAGSPVRYIVLVSNAGPSPATAVRLQQTLTDFESLEVSGACDAFPCTIARLPPGASARVAIVGRSPSAGAFEADYSASAAEPDPEASNDRASVAGAATAAGPPQDVGWRPPAWVWLAAVVAAAGGAAGFRWTRSLVWSGRVAVSVSTAPDSYAEAGPLSFAAPPVAITVATEPGEVRTRRALKLKELA